MYFLKSNYPTASCGPPSPGLPMCESLNNALFNISEIYGDNSNISAVYVDNDNFYSMIALAESLPNKDEPKKPDDKGYNFFTYNCMHFVMNVLYAGGVNPGLLIHPVPTSQIQILGYRFPKINYRFPKN